ncbi:MAG: DNA-directed RNA polymerase subunit D [Candidatus Methanomethylophilaceae archaeon]
MMQIEIVEMSDTEASFVLKDGTPGLANALRRVLISDVPKMAIDNVEFHLGPIMVDGREYESITPLFDEIVSHRLGLVPVPTDHSLFVFQEDCVCDGEGCPNCTIMYSLNKIGPCTVYSGDLMPLGSEELKVKDDLIPIIELGDGQAVLVYAIARMGTAKHHVKWQVTHGVGYKYMPIISVDAQRCDSGGKCLDLCPCKVFTMDGDVAVASNPLQCNLCGSCLKFCDMNAISMSEDDTQFIFTMETDGSLTAAQTLDYALKDLEGRFAKFCEDLPDA